jgi:hypothetical protein
MTRATVSPEVAAVSAPPAPRMRTSERVSAASVPAAGRPSARLTPAARANGPRWTTGASVSECSAPLSETTDAASHRGAWRRPASRRGRTGPGLAGAGDEHRRVSEAAARGLRDARGYRAVAARHRVRQARRAGDLLGVHQHRLGQRHVAVGQEPRRLREVVVRPRLDLAGQPPVDHDARGDDPREERRHDEEEQRALQRHQGSPGHG